MGKKSSDFSFCDSPTQSGDLKGHLKHSFRVRWGRCAPGGRGRNCSGMWLSQPRAEQAPERLLLSCLLNSVLQAEDGGEVENKKGRVWLAVPRLAVTTRLARLVSPGGCLVPILRWGVLIPSHSCQMRMCILVRYTHPLWGMCPLKFEKHSPMNWRIRN